MLHCMRLLLTIILFVCALGARAQEQVKHIKPTAIHQMPKISVEELGRNFPNTPMLGAIVKVSGVVDADAFVKDMEASFHHKFASKPQVIEGNMRALKRSMEEVQIG